MSGPYILPEAEHLLAEEVEFDLKLRGQVVDRRETLEDKQRFLRRLMKEEKKTKAGCKGKHYFRVEVENIEDKVRLIVSDLNKKFDRVLISRLRHYLIRAHSAVVESEEEETHQIEICRQIEQILKSHEQKIFMESEESWKDLIVPEKSQIGIAGKDDKSQKNQEDEKESEDERALQKQKELEAEWEEFIRWKQDRLFKEAKSNMRQSEETESGKHKGTVNDDEGPPKSYKSHKSRSRCRDSSGSSDGRSPERYKNRKSLREFQKVGNFERTQGDRRPPESTKSRRSRQSVSREKEGRNNRRSVSGRRESRYKRYSSESSVERSRKRRSKERSRRNVQSDSEDDQKRDRLKGCRRNRRRSLSSTESEHNRRHYRKSRVENWDLNFSGDSRSMQVEDFLSRIQKLSRHEGVSKEELLMNIHRRLKGEAYDWWFTREEHLTSWKKFESEIRFRYGNPNRDRGIRAQIRELKQRKGETFIAYVTEVEKLNQCLQRPFSSRTLFELIWENMRPHYRSKLSVLDIDDLEDLIEVNHKIDANDPGFYRPSQGNRNDLHHLQVESDYSSEDEVPVNTLKPNQRKSSTTKQQQQEVQQQKPLVTVDNSQQRQSNKSSSVVCWNCRKTGHIFRECRGPKQIFCYACGNAGKTTRNCDRDHSFLNQQRPQNNRSTN